MGTPHLLAPFWRDQGTPQQARLLQFTAGLRKGLKEAKALLDQLAP
jgi:hypothetical protein